jgi:predicted site-specific integrase-resolvase
MQKPKLLDVYGLSKEIGIPVRTLRTWFQARKIPYLRLGHRTLLFDPEKVRAALNKFEVQAAGSAK